jgi:hypothetical protein
MKPWNYRQRLALKYVLNIGEPFRQIRKSPAHIGQGLGAP